MKQGNPWRNRKTGPRIRIEVRNFSAAECLGDGRALRLPMPFGSLATTGRVD